MNMKKSTVSKPSKTKARPAAVRKTVPKPPVNSKKPPAKAINIVLVILLAVSVGAGVYFYRQYQAAGQVKQTVLPDDSQTILDSVKKRLLITETDQPVVARVDDPDKLKSSNQEFYKDSVTGDYLIIYPKRAIIYRQSNDQIINVAPIVNSSSVKAP